MRQAGVLLRLALALGLCAVSLAARADLDAVKPGQQPSLQADEGLVVVAIDTHVGLRKARLMRDGEIFGAGAMNELPVGRTHRLFVAKAGTYTWHDVMVGYSYWRLDGDEELRFKVEPGRITYAGDLLFRPGSWFGNVLATASTTLANRSLAAIDWLEEKHPALYARYRLAYTGHYPDPFPTFYREQRGLHPQATNASDVRFKEPPVPAGTLPVAIKTLWKAPRFQSASLNPAGDLLALEIRDDKEWRVELVDLAHGSTRELFTSKVSFNSLQWSGDRNLLVSLGQDSYYQTVWAVHVGQDATGQMRVDRIKFPREGQIVDPLPADPDHVLFASISGRTELMVHRVDISSEAALLHEAFSFKDRLNTGTTRDVEWATDGEGRLRLARIWRNEDQYWIHGRDGVFTDLMKLEGELGFHPMALSYDGMKLYALSDTDRGQRDAVVFDIATRKITETLFSRPGVDVDSMVFDDRRTPLAVTYQLQGRKVTESIGAGDSLGRALDAAFPGRTTHLASRSRDGGTLAVWTESADQPRQLHVLYVASGKTRRVDGNTPWLEKVRFAPTRLVAFKAKDGTPLEAFLTLPPGTGKRPLVVLPHGGPIGVADAMRFDPEVQFIASLGYAVLQVNFRGSDAYGKAFREAGHRNYGTGIEDDLDAAIEHVLASHPLDASRMCVVGSSYGGYSGLVAAVRWPERFRCVVSIAGVSDRLLFYTASDAGTTREGRALIEKIMGDPATQLAQLQDTSPLYQYERIRVPVMLAHGVEDRRVDFEHSRRMLRMLDLAGRTPVGLQFEDEGHSAFSDDNTEKLYTAVAGFLQQSLGAAASGTASTGTASAGIAPADIGPAQATAENAPATADGAGSAAAGTAGSGAKSATPTAQAPAAGGD